MSAPWIARLLAAIAAPTTAAKSALIASLGEPPDGESWDAPALPDRPGRPAHWREAQGPPLRRRRTLAHGPTRNRYLLALHHIEMSAIDLALAASLRGGGMPGEFHRDCIAVAGEEAQHAALLEGVLARRGIAPGDEPVHHRLWDAARACADLGDHLAAVPRILEARGLDAAAEVLPRLAGVDAEAHAALSRIYRDEIGHVASGTRWHRHWCAARGIDPAVHLLAIGHRLFPGQVPGPLALDRAGRSAAGFTDVEMDAWASGGRETV